MEAMALQAGNLIREQRARTLGPHVRRAAIVGKLLASSMRFFFEYLWSCVCQGLYLIKMWRRSQMTGAAKAFVCVSIGTGLLCSMAGPLTECFKMQRVGAPETLPDMAANLAMAEEKYQGLPDVAVRQNPTSKVFSEQLQETGVRKALGVCAALYWGSVEATYFMMDPECGQGVPWWAFLTFTVITGMTLAGELRIIYKLMPGTLDKLMPGRLGHWYDLGKDMPAIMAVLFGRLGQFDSFTGVANPRLVQKCAEEEDLTWVSVRGHVLHLPTDLGTLMVIGLVMIALLQALPGLLLLAINVKIEAACKFNELTMVLAASEADVGPQE